MAIDWDGLTTSRRTLIRNPFRVSHPELTAADAWFAANLDVVPNALVDLSARDAKTARKLALACAHAIARRTSVRSHLRPLEVAVHKCQAQGMLLTDADLRKIAWALERFQLAIEKLVGTSKASHDLRDQLWTTCFGPHLDDTLAKQAVIRQQNILILGETGTGKELVANVILSSVLTDDPGAPPSSSVNCAAIPESLAEAELFGAAKGAYSGLGEARVGKIVAASGGCMFLDEVADLPLAVQLKLLSTVSNGIVTPLGTNKSMRVDVRYVAATSQPVMKLVESEHFRKDLFNRLGHTRLTVTPLRERPEDIEAIGRAFVRRISPPSQRGELPTVNTVQSSTPDVVAVGSSAGSARQSPEEQVESWLEKRARNLPWGGNVRELYDTIRGKLLGYRQASPELAAIDGAADVPRQILESEASMDEVEHWYFDRVLAKVDGNVRAAAKILGKDATTVGRWIKTKSRTSGKSGAQ